MSFLSKYPLARNLYGSFKYLFKIGKTIILISEKNLELLHRWSGLVFLGLVKGLMV